MRRYDLRPFEPYDMKALGIELAQQIQDVLASERQDFAWTVLRNDAQVLSAGLRLIWPGRAEAWAILGTLFDRFDLLHTTRLILGRVDLICQELLIHRLEANTPLGYRAGCRWLEMLGFQKEAEMKFYAPDGSDHMLYARLRP